MRKGIYPYLGFVAGIMVGITSLIVISQVHDDNFVTRTVEYVKRDIVEGYSFIAHKIEEISINNCIQSSEIRNKIPRKELISIVDKCVMEDRFYSVSNPVQKWAYSMYLRDYLTEKHDSVLEKFQTSNKKLQWCQFDCA